MKLRRFAKPVAAFLLTLGLLSSGAATTGSASADTGWGITKTRTTNDTGWGIV